jgi:fumarylacetoacetase
MPELNETHDPTLRSWVESANDPASYFPIQNLPLGMFARRDSDRDSEFRLGVAIGDSVLDVAGACEHGLINVSDDLAEDLSLPFMNKLMEHDRAALAQLRRELIALLREDSSDLRDDDNLRLKLLASAGDVDMDLPGWIGNYTDFYASIHHATNVGSMFRPDQPLMPNYKHLPVGYHGRASSIVVSGTEIRRPMGQTKDDAAPLPVFGPSKLLDYELELGALIGRGNELGTRMSVREAMDHLFGLVIVNDWSARDVQKWEYQPLGPFNAKNFATTISPWVVTMEALEPFRVAPPPRNADDRPVLDYLEPVGDAGYDITLEVHLASRTMRESNTPPMLVSRGNFREMYWTFAQMLAHHTSTGCNMQPGDLIASGTISGEADESRGCLLERTWRGTQPLQLPDGSERRFLQDGDEVIMRAFCQREGFRRIGFGECRGIISPAR